MESAFVHLGRGNRVYQCLGLSQDAEYVFSRDYLSVELSLKEAYNPSTEELVGEAKRGNRLKLLPSGILAPRKEYLLVVPNKKLEEVAEMPGSFVIAPNSGDQAHFYAKFYKDYDLSQLDYLVKVLAFA